MSSRQRLQARSSSSVSAPETIQTVREERIPKLSPRARGLLTYVVGVGASGMCYLAVTANEGGGYFSREWVSLASVRACLADFLARTESFPTALLQAVYANRSVNNACFLVAILRHEGLLVAGDPPTLHRCAGEWEVWEAAQGSGKTVPTSPVEAAALDVAEGLSEASADSEADSSEAPTASEDVDVDVVVEEEVQATSEPPKTARSRGRRH